MHPYLFLRREFLRSKKLACADKPFRVLLALDGFRLSLETLDAAYERCSTMSRRVDVLVANCNTEPTPLLQEFLDRLNQNGIEYRLTMAEYSLASQVLRYTKRFPGIRTVLTNNPGGLSRGLGPLKESLLAEGYRFFGLTATPRQSHENQDVQPANI
jgi:hypothetical protein